MSLRSHRKQMAHSKDLTKSLTKKILTEVWVKLSQLIAVTNSGTSNSGKQFPRHHSEETGQGMKPLKPH